MNNSWRLPLLSMVVASSFVGGAFAALSQSDEQKYLANFDEMQAVTYSVADNDLPIELDVCKNSNAPTPTQEVTVQAPYGSVVDSSAVFDQCGNDSICILPLGVTLQVDTNLNLGALIVQGELEWTDSTQANPSAFVCGGYIVVEGNGVWNMDLQTKSGIIYLKNNGAVHSKLRTRAFGSHAEDGDYPQIDIKGRELRRTWSLLSVPLQAGDTKIKLMHNARLMGWQVGDRIGIAPTEKRATGHGEEFTVVDIDDKGDLLLDKAAQYYHAASFVSPQPYGKVPALMAAEVVNLSRNIVITGDEFKLVACENDLPEAVPGEQTSLLGCKCSSFRTQCTVGLHTAIMHGGNARISHTRIERCGQRGIEGKYCLHLHKLHDCPTCKFQGNAIEGSHQRGIIVHSTHASTVEDNVLYNVRGAGIYIEDGNEMYNKINYNVITCPFPFSDNALHGCTIPGTSNRIADTSDNQSGIFTRAATNSLTGNRSSNNFNGMLLKEGSIGRGESYGQVCESAAKIARCEGNTFHGNGRFGTYTLGFNYAKTTDQSILTNGWNVDKSLCSGFEKDGYPRGLSSSIVDNVDYDNAFVGHYSAGNIQYNRHFSHGNNNNLYWKESNGHVNGCSAHLTGGSYAQGTMALPDQPTFLIENTVFGQGTSLEAAHHCNVGTTGVLCFPTYMLHNVKWQNQDKSIEWIWFQWQKLQPHNFNQNDGGVFTLSPPDSELVMNGGELENSIFPPGYVSLVAKRFTYLLSLPGQPCRSSTEYGQLYDGGILCTLPLRAIKIYTRGLSPYNNPPNLLLETWYNKGGVENQVGTPDSSQVIGFHQTGSSGPKQGYTFPVIPSGNHSYRLTLAVDPGDMVVEFSDLIVGNRFAIEYTNLSVNGQRCGDNGLVSSHHDRRFIWSGDELLAPSAWGNTGACAVTKPPDFPTVDCSSINDGVLDADECPELCGSGCDEGVEYCDCGSGTCESKPGLELCSVARCEDHGHCAATYLGGDLPVTSNACICDEGWFGSLCQYNPCETLGLTCGHGTCVATSDVNAKCECDDGYTGHNCEESCDGFCQGSFPYNCATYIPGVLKYGCFSSGGCNYLYDGQNYPYDGFCTYKQASELEDCLCGSGNECEQTVLCQSDGSCPFPQNVPDNTPCNAVPLGACRSGVCVNDGSLSTPSPTKQPITPSPIIPTTEGPTKQPAITFSPNEKSYCGCNLCTQYIWDTLATDDSGSFSCGGRITWLRNSQGYSEDAACEKVSNEFPELCVCDPTTCNVTPSPTQMPTATPSHRTKSPTAVPSFQPTKTSTQKPSQTPSREPSQHPTTSSPTDQLSPRPSIHPTTSMPTKAPTLKPSPSQEVSYCGCSTCTNTIWNTPVTDGAGTFTCGQRISWLQSTDGGLKTEYESCKQVGEEFPSYCGPACNPLLCNIDNTLEAPDPSKLIWSDEFNVDGSPDPSKWDYDLEDGCQIGLCNWGNGEVAYYTKSSGNVYVANGVLGLRAKKEAGFSLPYTSARLVTRGLSSFKYGRVQFRASLSKCQARGTWPALWMLPEHKVYGGWPHSGEIDVMESVGHEQNNFFGTVHTTAYNGMDGTQQGSSISKSKDDWHIFEIDWTEDKIRFAVDGLVYFEYMRRESVDVWPFDQDFHLIMNVAVGGAWGGAQGIDDASFEGNGQIMEVDFVRVYSHGDMTPEEPTKQPSPPPFTSYCGCASCTQNVWDTLASDGSGTFSCGGRISWLQSAQDYNEADACEKVSNEFPDLCLCDTTTCNVTPKPTNSPSAQPTPPPIVTYCGCASCTQGVWDTLATDGSESYSCGSRISWLQNSQGYSEAGACEKVANEFPDLCLCNPNSCNLFV